MINEVVFGITVCLLLMILYNLNSKIDAIDRVVESLHNDGISQRKLQEVKLKVERSLGYLEGHEDGYQKGLEDRLKAKCCRKRREK